MTAVTEFDEPTDFGFDFEVVMKSPCHDATLTYFPTNWLNFASPLHQYVASLPADELTILDSDVTSSELPLTCPYDIEFSLVNRDGSTVDSSVFTYDFAT